MSRPSKNLTNRLTVRMAPEELQQLRDEAREAVVELATLARARLLHSPIPRRKSADHKALARVLVQLGHIGGNLNQIARHANTYGDLTAANDVQDLKTELASIGEAVRDALAS